MKVLICDDERQYSDAINAAIQRWQMQQPSSIVSVDTYNSSEDMLESLKCKTIYDLAFLDIQFPGEMNGLQVARELRLLNEQMVIVFISNYEEYAIDGYRVNALRFFYKPITDEQIFECLDLSYHQWQLMVDAQAVQIIRRFAAGQKIIVVDGDGLLLQLVGLANDDIEQALFAQVFLHGVILNRVKQDQTVKHAAGNEVFNGSKHLFFIAARDYGIGHLMGVAELADAANSFQIEGVFIHLAGGRRQNNANHTDGMRGLRVAGRRICFIAQFCHGLMHAFTGLLADGRMVVAYARHGGR